MWPADKRFMTPEQFKAHVAALDFKSWRPIGIVWHNTASPTLKRWHEYSRAHWMDGLESYYKGLGWSGGPHLFCDDGPDGIGLFNRLDARGTHSPSFNAQYVGIEHVGDFASEDDDTGPGLKVKLNGIAATAILCARLGIPVDRAHIKLHKEDPRTTHDCPGSDMAIDINDSIRKVMEYMGVGGDHDPNWEHVVHDTPVPPPKSYKGIVNIENLNIRAESSSSSTIKGVLPKGAEVLVANSVKNGSTEWYRLEPGVGWVAARYITLQ